MSVELQCVGTQAHPRIRIAAYITDTDRRYDDVYDNNLNCSFPKDIRVLGAVYRVPAENVGFKTNSNGKSWYTVKAKNIEVIGTPAPSHVYETATECVICLDEQTAIVFSPCGHLCACANCAVQINECCICRSKILRRINRA